MDSWGLLHLHLEDEGIGDSSNFSWRMEEWGTPGVGLLYSFGKINESSASNTFAVLLIRPVILFCCQNNFHRIRSSRDDSVLVLYAESAIVPE